MNNTKYIIALVFLVVVVGVVLTNLKKEDAIFTSNYGTERWWQDIIHEELSQRDGWESIEKEHRLDDGTRVDLLLPKQACEIDWADKWAEGIGQSIYYALKTRKAPLVILLAKKDGWEKYRDRVQYCGVECWVFDTRAQEWVDKE